MTGKDQKPLIDAYVALCPIMDQLEFANGLRKRNGEETVPEFEEIRHMIHLTITRCSELVSGKSYGGKLDPF